MKTYEEKGRLVISLEGRIDSSNSKETEAEIKRILEENAGKEFLLDAGDLEHISSAGLRVLLELHKNSGTGITIRNVSMEIYEILDVTGFTTFMKVKKKPRTVSVEGCPVIGKGVGDKVEFGGLLGYAPIMPVNPFGCEEFISRKGRIPAPIHSFKN